MLKPFLWNCFSLAVSIWIEILFSYCYTSKHALWLKLLYIWPSWQVIAVFPVDVWQLRRRSWWGPGEHVDRASHHPSTVFPFTPAANGPELQETSHCCLSQSATQAPCKLENFLFLFSSSSVFSSPFSLLFLCVLLSQFWDEINGVLPVRGRVGWGLELGGGEPEVRVILGPVVFFRILPFCLSPVGVGMGGERECIFFTYQNPVPDRAREKRDQDLVTSDSPPFRLLCQVLKKWLQGQHSNLSLVTPQ